MPCIWVACDSTVTWMQDLVIKLHENISLSPSVITLSANRIYRPASSIVVGNHLHSALSTTNIYVRHSSSKNHTWHKQTTPPPVTSSMRATVHKCSK